MPKASYPELILASTSPYRKKLLQRLGLPFRCEAPDTDETPLPNEDAAALAVRLAAQKAADVAARFPAALVIGSDQVALGPQGVMGKPATASRARQQLALSRGQTISFFTGVALCCPERGLALSHMEPFEVRFGQPSDREIACYVEREQPLDCAGSFKWEALGIALFEALSGDDPTALEGLPLIALCRLLREVGVEPLTGTGLSSAPTFDLPQQGEIQQFVQPVDH